MTGVATAMTRLQTYVFPAIVLMSGPDWRIKEALPTVPGGATSST